MKQVFVIHGGEAFNTYDEYLSYLKNVPIEIGERPKDWKSNLGENLGADFEVLAPRMPSPQNAKYIEWKIWFERHIEFLKNDVILVGHSLGGIFLTKYLSENDLPTKVAALLLVAAPYNTAYEHPLADFILKNDLQNLAKQCETIVLYHSKDDIIVPFSNALSYMKDIPTAKLVTLEDRGHFNQEQFPEIVADIKAL